MAWTTETDVDQQLETYQLSMTSTSGGAFAATATTRLVRGVIKQIHIEEDAVSPPDNGWDLTIIDGTSEADLTNGQGTGLTASTTLGPSDLKGGMWAAGTLTATGADMGNVTTVVITVYLVRVR